MTHISGTSYNGIEVADFAAGGLDASERIGRTVDKPRKKILRRAMMVLGLGGIAGAAYTEPQVLTRSWTAVAPYAQSLMDAARTPPTATAVVPPTAEGAKSDPAAPLQERFAALPAEKPQPPPQADPAATPAPSAPAPAQPVKPSAKAALAESSPAPGDAYAAPKPAPIDPLTKKAEAAGLHPDLSRALLQKLSDADFKTATTAVNKALTEVGDTETFIWPQKAAKSATRFRISFVPGAPQDCRRYVVEIAKDGWQTTALPVEKCGVKRVAARG